jgi:2-methylisocitrate lyase-like PEP mutase family enzyme
MERSHATLAERFQHQHRARQLLLPNAWDAASARIFEGAGFEAIGTTSAGIAYAHGVQDGERIGRGTMLSAVATIVRAVSCPVTADVEAGYGSGLDDVARTVAGIVDAGAVGINLEDSAPGRTASSLLDVDDQSRRIAAAREVVDRRGVPLVINARTDTFLQNLGRDVDERIAVTVDRGRRYLHAGADLVFVPGLVDPAIVKRVSDALQGRISRMAVPGAPPARDLFAAGAARVSIGPMAMLATLGLLQRIAQELREHGAWHAMESTFYGYGPAEALFARAM